MDTIFSHPRSQLDLKRGAGQLGIEVREGLSDHDQEAALLIRRGGGKDAAGAKEAATAGAT